MAFLLKSSKQILVRSNALKSSFYLNSRGMSSCSSSSTFSNIPNHHESSPTNQLINSFSDLFTCLKWQIIFKTSKKLMSGKRTPFKGTINNLLIETTMPTLLKASNSSLHPDTALKDLMNMHPVEIAMATYFKTSYLDTTLRGLLNGHFIQIIAATLFNASKKRTSSSDPKTTFKDVIDRHFIEIKAATLSKASEIITSSPYQEAALKDLINRHCIEITAATMLEACYDYELATSSSDPETVFKEFLVRTCTKGFNNNTVSLERTNFRFELNQEAFDVIVNMPGLEIQDTMVFVCDKKIVLIAKVKPASDRIVRVIKMLKIKFSPKVVTGRIIEGGELKISFPSEKEEEFKRSTFFQVNLLD